MNHDIRHPLTDAEKTTISIDPQKGQGTPYVTLHVGQDPTLTEMYESIIWAAQNLTPTDVVFEIDPVFAGEQEYNQVFQYLNSAGFKVSVPGAKKVAVPVFNEEDIVITSPDGEVLTVPSEDVPKPKVVHLAENRFTDYREEGMEGGSDSGIGYGTWNPGQVISYPAAQRPMTLVQGVALGVAGIALTSLLTATLLKKGN